MVALWRFGLLFVNKAKPMILSEEEIKCVQQVAKWFEENKDFVGRKEAMKQLRVNDSKYDILIKKMEHIGVVEDVESVMGDRGYGKLFRPSASAQELWREIKADMQKEAAPPDIIEQLKRRARQNPLTAWVIIIFLILALLIPMLNSLVELIRKIIDLFY